MKNDNAPGANGNTDLFFTLTLAYGGKEAMAAIKSFIGLGNSLEVNSTSLTLVPKLNNPFF